MKPREAPEFDERKPPQQAPGHGHAWITVDVDASTFVECESCGELQESTECHLCEECVVLWCADCARR